MKLFLLNFFFLVLFFAFTEARKSRIFNGNEAKDGQFPYVSLLTYGKPELYINWCGAAIIHPRWAVTAAFCVLQDFPSGISLTVGTAGDFGTGKIYEIDQFYVHENYTYSTEEIVRNDIALIRLASDIEFNDKVNKIKLETDETKNYEDTVATVMGWGNGKLESQPIDRLYYAEVPLLSMEECKKGWMDADEHLCTFNEKRGVCFGDGGSPLVDDGVLIGVVSTTSINCDSLKPDLYTKVASYIPWIKNKLNEYGDSLE